jgi:hypothetical protein
VPPAFCGRAWARSSVATQSFRGMNHVQQKEEIERKKREGSFSINLPSYENSEKGLILVLQLDTAKC